MNLQLAHQILIAADEQRDGFLLLRGFHLARQVELLTSAHLVESTISDDHGEAVAVINRITDLGHKFIRSLNGVMLGRDSSPPVNHSSS